MQPSVVLGWTTSNPSRHAPPAPPTVEGRRHPTQVRTPDDDPRRPSRGGQVTPRTTPLHVNGAQACKPGPRGTGPPPLHAPTLAVPDAPTRPPTWTQHGRAH